MQNCDPLPTSHFWHGVIPTFLYLYYNILVIRMHIHIAQCDVYEVQPKCDCVVLYNSACMVSEAKARAKTHTMA